MHTQYSKLFNPLNDQGSSIAESSSIAAAPLSTFARLLSNGSVERTGLEKNVNELYGGPFDRYTRIKDRMKKEGVRP